MVPALAATLAIGLLGPGDHVPPRVFVQAEAEPWWICVVEYETTRYVSGVFSGDRPASVHEARFARYVEEVLSGHYRPARCDQESSMEDASARLQQEIARTDGHVEPTGWAP